MKAFVISFNRITVTREMCEYLADNGCEPILIDNGSSYPPLLEWYKTCPHKVHMMPAGSGHRSLWQSGLINQYPDEHYIVTDHDLDLSGVPGDFVDVLFKGLEWTRGAILTSWLKSTVLRTAFSFRRNILKTTSSSATTRSTITIR